MKRGIESILIVVAVLAFGLGCGTVTEMLPGSEPAKSDSASNPLTNPETVLRDKTGVPECDAVIDFLADQSKTQDDNYVTRAAKEFFFNKIRQSIKESVERNKNNPKELAKDCGDFKKQLDAQLASQKEGASK